VPEPRHHGFSLVELIIVIAVLGILAALALPRYQSVRVKAEVAAMTANLKALKQACDRAYEENGQWPVTPENMAKPRALDPYLTDAQWNHFVASFQPAERIEIIRMSAPKGPQTLLIIDMNRSPAQIVDLERNLDDGSPKFGRMIYTSSMGQVQLAWFFDRVIPR